MDVDFRNFSMDLKRHFLICCVFDCASYMLLALARLTLDTSYLWNANGGQKDYKKWCQKYPNLMHDGVDTHAAVSCNGLQGFL